MSGNFAQRRAQVVEGTECESGFSLPMRMRVPEIIRALTRVIVFGLIAHGMCSHSLAGPAPRSTLIPRHADASVDPSQFSHTFWGLAQGAPQNILDIAQTSDGLLWLASDQGLYTFDGIRFQRFKAPSGQELLSTNVSAVFAPRTGGLWVGYSFGGFSFIQAGHIRNYIDDRHEYQGSVMQIAQSPNGDLWAASFQGLLKLANDGWHRLGPEWNLPENPVTTLGFDKQGRLWTCVGHHIFELEPGGTRFLMLPGPPVDAYIKFTRWPDGEVWTHSLPGDIGAKDGPHVSPLLSAEIQATSASSLIDRTGSMWVFNTKSALRFSDVENNREQPDAKQLRPGMIFAGIDPDAYFVDHEGKIWISRAGGLHRFSYTPLRTAPLKVTEYAPAISSSANGLVYVAVMTADNSGLIYRVTASGMQHVRAFDDPVRCIYAARDGSSWFANSDLWHLRNGKLLRTPRPAELKTNSIYVQAMTADHEGNLWVSYEPGGIYSLRDGSWTHHKRMFGLHVFDPIVEYTDSDNYVWFGFDKSKLLRFRDGKADLYGPSDGLDIGTITAIQVNKGEIWVGGEMGLEHYEHGRFHRLNATTPDTLRGISGMIRTPNGDLWLNGLAGIVHIQVRDLQLSLADSTHVLTGQRFGREDGLVGYAPQVQPLPSAIQGSDGRLWFSTRTGVFWLDPANAVKPTIKPVVSIKSIIADGKQQSIDTPLSLPGSTSNVRIEYEAVNLSEPESLHYRYKLQGSGSDWQNADEQKFVSYVSLIPGTYTFLVEATDNNGVWSESPTSVSIRILPRFYQTWWFLPLVVLVILICLYVLFRVRIEQHAKQARLQYEGQLTERTRVARELHDTFMQTVQASKMAVDEARKSTDDPACTTRTLDLAELSCWLGQATEEGRAALNSLRAASADECELQEALRRAIEECQVRRFTNSSLAVTGQIRETYPAVRDEIYRVAYEAINNACTHSQANQLVVHLMYTRDLTVRITDDGIGIDPLVAEKGKDGHFGLRGMRERVARIKGTFTLATSAEAGTEITILVPGRIVFRKTNHSPLIKLRNRLMQSREPSQLD